MYICNRTPHIIRIYNEADCVADPAEKRGALSSTAGFTLVPAGEISATVRYGGPSNKDVICDGIITEDGEISGLKTNMTIASMAGSEVFFSPRDWGQAYTYYIVSNPFYQAAKEVNHAHLARMVTVGPAVNISDPHTRGCAGLRQD